MLKTYLLKSNKIAYKEKGKNKVQYQKSNPKEEDEEDMETLHQKKKKNLKSRQKRKRNDMQCQLCNIENGVLHNQ